MSQIPVHIPPKPRRKYNFDWMADIGRLLFPSPCAVCKTSLHRSEYLICVNCDTKLPRTNFHRLTDNIMTQKFQGRLPLHHSTAYLDFQKGNPAQKLLHQLKYQGKTELGILLGQKFGADLLRDNYAIGQLIIPLPLHPSKERLRGYNQSVLISEGLGQAMEIGVETNAVSRQIANPTQTNKARYERWENVAEIFKVDKPELIRGKHVCLLDDVVTTGATIEACSLALLGAGARRLTILALAAA